MSINEGENYPVFADAIEMGIEEIPELSECCGEQITEQGLCSDCFEHVC